jgi:hypothetical protein
MPAELVARHTDDLALMAQIEANRASAHDRPHRATLLPERHHFPSAAVRRGGNKYVVMASGSVTFQVRVRPGPRATT